MTVLFAPVFPAGFYPRKQGRIRPFFAGKNKAVSAGFRGGISFKNK